MQPDYLEAKKTPGFQEKLIDRINLEVAEFFGAEPIEPNVIVYDSKEAFDADWKNGDDKQIPDWVVAFADYEGRTHILSPDIMPAGSERTSQQRFEKILKHETSHHYVRQMNKDVPIWLNEGVCLFVANQDTYQEDDPKNITLDLLEQLHDAITDERIYWVGKNMVDMIVEEFGKEKLFEIVAITDKNTRYSELKKLFEWLK